MDLPRLVALSPGTLEPDGLEDFKARVRSAVEAGLPGLLLREGRLDDRHWLRLFGELRERHPDLWLAGHDRVHLALRVPCQALHLGFRSLPPEEVRALAEGRLVGLSTHDPDDPSSWAGADYRVHGPVLPTPSKEGLLEPLGADGLARTRTLDDGRPVLAIGGLCPEDVGLALGAGAHGVCVLSGLLPRPDPAERTRAYLAALEVA